MSSSNILTVQWAEQHGTQNGNWCIHRDPACGLYPLMSASLVPRPHSLTRRNGLVNQVEFLGLAGALATV